MLPDKQGNRDPTLKKTKLCKYHFRSICHYGDGCHFAHSSLELREVPDFRHTKLCNMFLQGRCLKNDCTFAHGSHELRSRAPQDAAALPIPMRLVTSTLSHLMQSGATCESLAFKL
mmetsp:Transcript_45537/g.120850  ORF Transcript_45537/g.120850 Transcript_45537/m.120850 type:complete len:116 (-) Transcript_45537:322-669(-)